MKRLRNSREEVLEASRAYYAHRAYYEDFLVQRLRRFAEANKRELDFIEHVFNTHANRPIKKVLDIACGSGRHVFGLAKLGYECTGIDYTPERIQIAKERAKREDIPVKLLQGDATQLNFENEFDAVLALYILFLLPNDDDVLRTLRGGYHSLRKGGILVCNVGNPLYAGRSWFSLQTIYNGFKVVEDRVPGIHSTEILRLREFDPMHGVVWWQETSTIETPTGTHVFRDKERLRLFTYWDIVHYLQVVGFKRVKCYPEWQTNPRKKTKAEALVFVSRKD
jgi:2-polyprenyl-3-methyl-5-hydroxy-6-metoxy-1,4-benzoquinol methylase